LESLCAGIFEMSCQVRGYEQFYMDLALNPRLACTLLDKFVELKLQFYKVAAEQLGGYVQFVRDFTFWGGAIDPQAFAVSSPQGVRREVRQRIGDLAPGGGFIFGAIHNIQTGSFSSLWLPNCGNPERNSLGKQRAARA
jgi:hypothetical protein